MNSKVTYYWLLVALPVFFISWYFISKTDNKPIRQLPYFGPKHVAAKTDTSYHRIPDFAFVNQYNQIFNSDSIKNTIYVTEYFFTTCKSICPIMNNNLVKVYQRFKNRKDFLILSHTVDPETDSVSVLLSYAMRHKVDNTKWQFLTGQKSKLYELARKGYLLNAEEGIGDADDFIHTQNFALIDKDRHIRGFYDGTDSLEINRLIIEIELLLDEYDYKEHRTH